MNDTSATTSRRQAGPSTIAIVGPFQAGKTTLLEGILARAGAIQRPGAVDNGTSVGDASAEARAHHMSVEANIATCDYLGESMTFVDCPGSVELLQDMQAVLPFCDAAVVVCEADPRKVPALQVILHALEELALPRFLFLNKIDISTSRVRETLKLLQPASRTPLLLRQIPLWKNGIATGFIDLALERAFIYREHAQSEVVDLPDIEIFRKKEARFSMLERLADYDDALMENLIDEMEPPRDRVFGDLASELRGGNVMPVLIGAAQHGNGVTRLLKALRHEGPALAQTQARLGIAAEGEPLIQVMRTIHTAHGGKLSVARLLRGGLSDGDSVTGPGGVEKLSGLSRMLGGMLAKRGAAEAGETVALGRLDSVVTGQTLSTRKAPEQLLSATPPQPLLGVTIRARERKDDARLSAAFGKLREEDAGLVIEPDPETGEISLRGQGEMHLRLAQARLTSRFGIALETSPLHSGYRETIRGAAQARGRHRKQSGGHGQFGDVVLHIRPLPRGEGFRFVDEITGGVVPRNYIPSVEEGVRAYLGEGPLGFPVVDIEVRLTDGSYHTVDSSDMAFQQAARLAMQEAMPQAHPVLLEPILAVEIATPDEALAKVTALATSRRGQMLGYDARPGWEGWSLVQALIPEAEIGDLVVELRSATAGVGSFTYRPERLAELLGRQADTLVEQNRRSA